MSETEPQFKGPAIAVVVPVHNGAAFLQQCLASVSYTHLRAHET